VGDLLALQRCAGSRSRNRRGSSPRGTGPPSPGRLRRGSPRRRPPLPAPSRGTARNPTPRLRPARRARPRAVRRAAPLAPGRGRPPPTPRSRAHPGKCVVAGEIDLRELDVAGAEPALRFPGKPKRPDVGRSEHNVGRGEAPAVPGDLRALAPRDARPHPAGRDGPAAGGHKARRNRLVDAAHPDEGVALDPDFVALVDVWKGVGEPSYPSGGGPFLRPQPRPVIVRRGLGVLATLVARLDLIRRAFA
jgi:hypothetical protein